MSACRVRKVLVVEDGFAEAQVTAGLAEIDMICAETDCQFLRESAAFAAASAGPVSNDGVYSAAEGHDGPGIQFEAQAQGAPPPPSSVQRRVIAQIRCSS